MKSGRKGKNFVIARLTRADFCTNYFIYLTQIFFSDKFFFIFFTHINFNKLPAHDGFEEEIFKLFLFCSPRAEFFNESTCTASHLLFFFRERKSHFADKLRGEIFFYHDTVTYIFSCSKNYFLIFKYFFARIIQCDALNWFFFFKFHFILPGTRAKLRVYWITLWSWLANECGNFSFIKHFFELLDYHNRTLLQCVSKTANEKFTENDVSKRFFQWAF